LPKSIGWIGLGHMGTLMAKNLANANFNVKVWNRTLSKAKESGLPFTNTLEGLVLEQDIIITMLSDAQAVEDIYERILELKIDGKVFIDMTTVKPETPKKLAEKLLKKNASFLEAPVIGSTNLAEKGLLTIIVSGDEEVFKECSSVFSVLGKEIFYLGDYGVANTIKLINNGVLASLMAVFSEAIATAEKSGIPIETAVKVLENGAGKSTILEYKKDKILKKDFSPQFSVKLLIKDLNYLSEILDKNFIPGTFSEQAKNLYKMAKSMGLEEEDISAIYEVMKKISGAS